MAKQVFKRNAQSLKAWNSEYRNKGQVWRSRFNEPFQDGIFTGKKVLELGVGNGKALEKILLQKPRSVKAVDFSPIAVRLCGKKFSGIKNVKFFEADVQELPFKNSEFDIIVCFHTLGHLLESELPKAVSEIKRVLKPEGKLLFEDFAIGDFRFGKGTEIEKNTFRRGNGITYHYFFREEVGQLFQMRGSAWLVEKELKLAGKKVSRKEIKAEFLKD